MNKKLLGVIGAGFFLALAPVAVDVDTSGRAVVRLDGACGQATGCTINTNALCSMHNGNERGYECRTGCENTET